MSQSTTPSSIKAFPSFHAAIAIFVAACGGRGHELVLAPPRIVHLQFIAAQSTDSVPLEPLSVRPLDSGAARVAVNVLHYPDAAFILISAGHANQRWPRNRGPRGFIGELLLNPRGDSLTVADLSQHRAATITELGALGAFTPTPIWLTSGSTSTETGTIINLTSEKGYAVVRSIDVTGKNAVVHTTIAWPRYPGPSLLVGLGSDSALAYRASDACIFVFRVEVRSALLVGCLPQEVKRRIESSMRPIAEAVRRLDPAGLPSYPARLVGRLGHDEVLVEPGSVTRPEVFAVNFLLRTIAPVVVVSDSAPADALPTTTGMAFGVTIFSIDGRFYRVTPSGRQ